MPGATPRQRRPLDDDDSTVDERREERVVPCLYCREQIPAASFVFWSSTRRLMSATCPSCRRRVTLTTATWRRWRAVLTHALR